MVLSNRIGRNADGGSQEKYIALNRPYKLNRRILQLLFRLLHTGREMNLFEIALWEIHF